MQAVADILSFGTSGRFVPYLLKAAGGLRSMRRLSRCLAGITLLTLISSAAAQVGGRTPPTGAPLKCQILGRASNTQGGPSLQLASLKKGLDSGSSALT